MNLKVKLKPTGRSHGSSGGLRRGGRGGGANGTQVAYLQAPCLLLRYLSFRRGIVSLDPRLIEA